MPFINRVVRPTRLKRLGKKDGLKHEDFDDVSNYTLTGAILQLASISNHAEDIFGGINEEMVIIYRRCSKMSEQISRVQNMVDEMDTKKEIVPVSDLDIEKGLPLYLHYQSPNSLEEDLFTRDSRTPCLIHLHQRARQDLNYILRGSEAYAKAGRPRSLDPSLLLDDCSCENYDPYLPRSNRNSSFFSSSNHLNAKQNEVSLSSPQENLDSSGAQVDIIAVDTSGTKFERQANLRRSQRLSSCTVRQRANLTQRRQLRSRHKTLTGLPGNISSELGDPTTPRPFSLLSNNSAGGGTGTGSSFVDASSDESRSMINGHVVVSPRQNQRNAEIQTDDVRVIPLSPAQRKLRHKGLSKSHNVSPTSSHASTEFMESPTAVPCPIVPQKNQTSTPINKEKNMIRPTTLDVTDDNDTSTDEGRHTGESNPPTPVHTGRKKEVSSNPHANASPSSPMATKCQQNGIPEKDHGIEMRINGARLQQGEDRTSSGVWSGTESTRHSSTSDIMTQHAQNVASALQQVKQNRLNSPGGSPVTSKSAGQISPLVGNRSFMTSSAVSSSSVSINSRLSTLERSRSNTSMPLDDDDRYHSTNSSVVSVTINRSNTSKSNLSINSTEGGTALSAAALLKKSRKGRFNTSGGAYNFMNYEVDPLENQSDSISRALKSRRSNRSSKHRGGSSRRLNAEDNVSIADSSCKLTETDGNSVHSELTPNDSISLCDSTFSVDQEGYYTSMHDDCGISKTVSPSSTSISSAVESLPPDIPPPDIPDYAKTPKPASPSTIKVVSPTQKEFQAFFGNKFKANSTGHANSYNSYNRAVNSNHSTPKTLISPRGQSQSVKTPKSAEPALDFQSELNKRLSLRRTASPGGTKSSIKKEKRGAPPPPPKRCSSLSSGTPSPSLSHKSYSGSIPPSPALSTRSPLTTSPTSPMQKIEEKPKSSQGPEVHHMETLPPPPPPEQLHDLSEELKEIKQRDMKPVSPISFPPAVKAKRPPPPAKPQRTSSIGGKHAPVTKPKPSVHISGPQSSKPTAPATAVKPQFEKPTSGKPNDVTTADPKISKVVETKDSKQTKKEVITVTKIIQEKVSTVSSPEKGKDVPNHKVAVVSAPVAKETEKAREASDVTKSPKVTVKTPPPVVSPKFSKVKSPTQKKKEPPATSPKPVTSPKNDDTNASFDSKRNREQSPSYRTSLARAAFFGQPTPVETPERQEKKTPEKQEKETPEIAKTENEPKKSESSKENTEKEVSNTPVKNEKDDSSEVKIESTPKEEVKEMKKSEVVNKGEVKEMNAEETLERVETPENNDWLGKIAEFSAPNRSPKPTVTSSNVSASERLKMTSSESAASRLQSEKATATASPKFSTYENLLAAIHKSKRDTLSGKPLSASPPTSPGTNNDVFTFRTNGVTSSNGNHSPVSTLERKRNGRLTQNGHRNGISRKSTGGTSRDDFKALLLQNACRTSSSSQMTAAEKLLRNKSQFNSSSLPRQRPHSVAGNLSYSNGKVSNDDSISAEMEDVPDTPRPMLSLSDIRSAITLNNPTGRQGRPVRRGNKPNGIESAKKAATLSVHGKKLPPQSMSSKYNVRSRTPTRPMMAISEDSETEKSPEQAAREKAKVEER